MEQARELNDGLVSFLDSSLQGWRLRLLSENIGKVNNGSFNYFLTLKILPVFSFFPLLICLFLQFCYSTVIRLLDLSERDLERHRNYQDLIEVKLS